jgi:hypothetical protein
MRQETQEGEDDNMPELELQAPDESDDEAEESDEEEDEEDTPQPHRSA